MDELKLRLSKPNGPQFGLDGQPLLDEEGQPIIIRAVGCKGVDAYAPEPHGTWGVRNVVPSHLVTRPIGFNCSTGMTQYSYINSLRAPRDFVGEGNCTIVWTPLGEYLRREEETVEFYFADGPVSLTRKQWEAIKRDIPVVFWPTIGGKRMDARYIYLDVPFAVIEAINEHFSYFGADQSRSVPLTPELFESEFGLIGWPKTEVRKLAEKKPWNAR